MRIGRAARVERPSNTDESIFSSIFARDHGRYRFSRSTIYRVATLALIDLLTRVHVLARPVCALDLFFSAPRDAAESFCAARNLRRASFSFEKACSSPLFSPLSPLEFSITDAAGNR